MTEKVESENRMKSEKWGSKATKEEKQNEKVKRESVEKKQENSLRK